MIYDSNPKDQISESIAALKTVQYALMSDGVNEDSFACLQMNAIRSLEDAIARIEAKHKAEREGLIPHEARGLLAKHQ